ncbi:MAG: hypothetical protein QOG59_1255, partial [Solirubrobacteraceae bacterium]|nr:hypothetical protein [Solirubrobacteraceae bacterium]
GRMSLDTHPWLADHAVRGTALVPATAFLELAFQAATRVGCAVIEELILEAPLTLPSEGPGAGPVHLQVMVGAPDSSSRRTLSVHSRREAAPPYVPWTCHARGSVIGADAGGHLDPDTDVAPPPDAVAVPMDGYYERLAAAGYDYGPAFCNLRSVSQRGDTIYGTVSLDETFRADACRFGVHPALLDAALHAMLVKPPKELVLPFAWRGVRLYSAGASTLQVRLDVVDDHSVAVTVADLSGGLVATAEALMVRPVSEAQLRAAHGDRAVAPLTLAWTPIGLPSTIEPRQDLAFVGASDDLPRRVLGDGCPVVQFRDLDALIAALSVSERVPLTVVIDCRAHADSVSDADGVVKAAHAETARVLGWLQSWLGESRFAGGKLVVVTQRAVAATPNDGVLDLVHAPLWGLLRTFQTEHPHTLGLIDLDDQPYPAQTLLGAVASGEPQLALRSGTALTPQLVGRKPNDALTLPVDGTPWCLDVIGRGSPDELTIVDAPEALRELAPDEVRIAVRAAGLNFRDGLVMLGHLPAVAQLPHCGYEAAGVVTAVGADVTRYQPGDDVMGLFYVTSAFAPIAITDHRLLVRIPAGFSYAQAATFTVVFATAYDALVRTAQLQPGHSVLIHGAAGGVGMAAIQLATHLGAEVFATASPAKWSAVRALNVPDSHIASSRTCDFEAQFQAATEGRGVDVVLNCLTGEFLDASVRLLAPHGRFIELGKTDLRAEKEVARVRPSASYNMLGIPEGIRAQETLTRVVELQETGAISPLPVQAWDVRQAPEAFRFLTQSRHVGKLALSMPRTLDTDGTVLITGGTGTLGSLLARHLVQQHGVRHLLLTSRRGVAAPGIADLVEELARDGADVRVVASDTADRAALARTLADIPPEHPLTAVVHTAGTLDDNILEAMTPDQLTKTLRPKIDAAYHLHQLTCDRRLSAFIAYSSLSGLLGMGAQANYAAGNAFLDALAHHRRSLGLPATSIAWGLWERASGLTDHLNETDLTRIANIGILPISDQTGLSIFDQALRDDRHLLIGGPINAAASHSDDGTGYLLRALRVRASRP